MNIICIKFLKLTMSVEDIIGTLSNINLSFNNQIVPQLPNSVYQENINGYIFNCFDNNEISYYYNISRCKWIPFRNRNKENNTKIFFVDEHILSFEQINNLEYYNNLLGSLIFMEEWKIDECFPGYSFSSLGRMKLKNGEISERKTNGNGYIIINICNNCGETGQHRIHRIIAKLFIMKVNEEFFVWHMSKTRYCS